MLRVTVELCPRGKEMGRKILAEGVIYQDLGSMTLDQMDLTPYRDYKYVFNSEDLKGNKIEISGDIKEYDRRQSSLKLLKQCLYNSDFEE